MPYDQLGAGGSLGGAPALSATTVAPYAVCSMSWAGFRALAPRAPSASPTTSLARTPRRPAALPRRSSTSSSRSTSAPSASATPRASAATSARTRAATRRASASSPNHESVTAIERTGAFHGLYHVLGGVISPMDKIGPRAAPRSRAALAPGRRHGHGGHPRHEPRRRGRDDRDLPLAHDQAAWRPRDEARERASRGRGP